MVHESRVLRKFNLTLTKHNQSILAGHHQLTNRTDTSWKINDNEPETLLRHIILPLYKQQEIEAEKFITLLTHGKDLDTVASCRKFFNNKNIKRLHWIKPSSLCQKELDQFPTGTISEPKRAPAGMQYDDKSDWFEINQDLIQKWIMSVDGVPDNNHVQTINTYYNPPKWEVRYLRYTLPSISYGDVHFVEGNTVDDITGFENPNWGRAQTDLPSTTIYAPRIIDPGFGSAMGIRAFGLEAKMEMALRTMSVSTYQTLKAWPHENSERLISFQIDFRLSEVQCMRTQKIRLVTDKQKSIL